ncbi:F390 synthetase-related protein [Moellerella wisconsensis]|uniref:F390 synthetase-related protein n=1 Tax=Moellerella wisconsensis TaxID=158849 RepID=UPI000640C65C|nr:F390 synthetase-related protein [Moellerella wisconsensis]KLN96844.1 coenzyme F390 synthetase [Moellerella wisconsensis]
MLATLWHYWRASQRSFADRSALEAHQQAAFQRHAQRILTKSRYFAPYVGKPLAEYPLMNKQIMMENFNEINTVGLSADILIDCAQRSEKSRNFSPTVGKYSVGLSSGTSGRRGLFVVSPREQHIWSGAMLAKMLPNGLFHGERVALFLRANNNLYESVNNRWLSFRFYDLMADFQQQLAQLAVYQPTIIVAPAQVLCAIAKVCQQQKIRLSTKKVISVAEVLQPHDKQFLAQTFSCVAEVYQATEGFLGCTCAHGTLHLNEAFLHIEPKWLDSHRFSPIITDFTRETQPIIRYQLDDILVIRTTPCPCGDPQIAIERIEGRCDDQLQLKDETGHPITIFADPCARLIANQLPLTADFRLIQHGSHLTLQGECNLSQLSECQHKLMDYFKQQGADTEILGWTLQPAMIESHLANKRRRIMRREEA